MKISNLLIASVCIAFFCQINVNFLKAQAPEAINYQAVVRNSDGSPRMNQSIIVRLTIYSGELPTTIVYVEEHDIITNDHGLFSLAIGKGTVDRGDFASIGWGSETHHLSIEINAGEGFASLGTIPFLSVPYSLYAKKAGNVFSGSFNDLTDVPVNLDTDRTNDLTNESMAGGDADGAFDNLTVSGLKGRPLSDIVPDSGEYLKWDGKEWLPDSVRFNFRESQWLVNDSKIYYNDGFVGIGTNDPLSKFHVSGGDLIIQDDFPVLRLNGSGSNKIISFQQNDTEQGNISYSNGIGLRANGGADFITGSWVLDPDGNFGLGLTDPQRKLHVHFNNNSSSASQALISQAGGGDAWMNFGLDGSTHYAIGIDNSDGDKFKIGYNSSTAGGVGENTLFTITSSGNFGIKTSNPTARLHVSQGGQNVGTGLRLDDGLNEVWDITHGFGLRLHYGGDLRGFFNATTGAYVQSSDLRLKSGIENMNEVLTKVKSLKALSYNYLGAETSPSKKSIGFVAQDVASVFPELVHYSERDDVYGIDYSGFGVVAIKAIQEQQAIIDNQSRLIEELTLKMEFLERKINTK